MGCLKNNKNNITLAYIEITLQYNIDISWWFYWPIIDWFWG